MELNSVSLVNGHIDKSVITISERIAALIEADYLDENYKCHLYSHRERYENGKFLQPKNLIEEIEEILKEEKVDKFFTEIIDVSIDPDGRNGCLCVSWLKEHNLYGFNEPIYGYY